MGALAGSGVLVAVGPAPGSAPRELGPLHAATTVELPGTLTLRADALELAARTGDVRIEARGDVRVNGDHIRLNGS